MLARKYREDLIDFTNSLIYTGNVHDWSFLNPLKAPKFGPTYLELAQANVRMVLIVVLFWETMESSENLGDSQLLSSSSS